MFWFGKKKDNNIDNTAAPGIADNIANEPTPITFTLMNNFDNDIEAPSWEQIQLYIGKMAEDAQEFVTLSVDRPVGKVSFVQAALDNMHDFDLEVGLGDGVNNKVMQKRADIAEVTKTLLEFYNTGDISDTKSFWRELKMLPAAIGIGALADWEKDNYETSPCEYLVAIGGGGACGVGASDKFSASVPILGYINLTTGQKSDVRSMMKFVPTKIEQEHRGYFDEFNKLTVYKIKALAPKYIENAEPWVNNEFRMSGLYALSMLSVNEPDEFLDGLILKYKTPVVIHTENYGEMTLDKDLGHFEGECDWLGEKAKLFLEVEDGQEDAGEALAHMDFFYKDLAERDKSMREFAAKELTELANEWQSSDCEIDEDGEPINYTELTEGDFVQKISIDSMSMDSDGNFSVFYYDGDLFFGHSVVVEGDLENGLDSATMQG